MKQAKRACGQCAGVFDNVLQTVDSREDADRLLSYYTRQEVLFLDAKLGVTFRLIQLSLVAFIVGYMFIWKEGYLQVEQAKGGVVTHVSGDAVAVSSGKPTTRYFGIEEITYPGLENGNIFIATRQTVTRQMRGMCDDPSVPCITDNDCTAFGDAGKGKCSEAGFCHEHSWCSVDDDEAEIFELESDKVQIWARSFIQYVKLAPEKLFTTETERNGPNSENTYTVRQILKMCEPLPVNYEEVAELGGVFEVGFRWDCNIRKNNCKPGVVVRRLDTIFDPDNIGYSFKYAEVVDSELRLQNEVRGLRFFFRTTGAGKKVSVAATIVTGSMSATLLSFAIVIADLLLTKVFAMRKKYNARKFENSPDFSEYMEELIEKRSHAIKVTDIDDAEMAVEEKERAWLSKFQEDAVR